MYKFGTTYLFLQPLKLAISNLVYVFGLGSSLPRNNFYDQHWRGSGLGDYPKNAPPPTYFCNSWSWQLQIWFSTWAWGRACQEKKLLRPILAGVWARAASKKIGTPYLFLQPLKLVTLNLVYKLGLGVAYQETTFRTKTGRGLDYGALKNRTPTFFCNTVEASNFNIGTQRGFGEHVTMASLVRNLVRASCATGAPQKMWVSRTPYHVPCTN